jgi:cytochrome c-type biogenesis protein CcmH/NrfG
MKRNLRLARPLTRVLAVAVLGAAWLAAVPVNAQENAPAQSTPPQPSEQAPNINDQKLDAVAAALEHVASIRDDYQQRIDQLAPADRKRLADEANSALANAVTEQGLSVDEYTSILVVAQNDPVVRQKILQRIKPPAK